MDEGERLYNAYYMQVYSFLMAQTREQSLAEELTEQTFFKAMLHYGQYRGQCSELTWLCAIAKNLYADELRRRSRCGPLEEEPIAPAQDMESRTADKDAAFRIHVILHQLPEPYKEVFQLRVFGELSFRQVGAIFQKSENWARVTYHRARLKMQERMDEYGNEL